MVALDIGYSVIYWLIDLYLIKHYYHRNVLKVPIESRIFYMLLIIFLNFNWYH